MSGEPGLLVRVRSLLIGFSYQIGLRRVTQVEMHNDIRQAEHAVCMFYAEVSHCLSHSFVSYRIGVQLGVGRIYPAYNLTETAMRQIIQQRSGRKKLPDKATHSVNTFDPTDEAL